MKYQCFDPTRIAGPTARRYWAEHLGGSDSQLETFANNGMLRPGEWHELKLACDSIGIGFLATPFDLEAVDLLEDVGVTAYKIASGDLTYRQLIQKVAATGKPVFLSTGASYSDEVARALGWLASTDVILLACTLTYPCPTEDANLARIETLCRTFPGRRVGLSDHTLGIETALAAVAAGATVLEKHCTLGGDNVPDDRMAVGPLDLAAYVGLAQLGEKLRGNGVLSPMASEEAARAGARRSIHAARDIEAGERFRPDDFVFLRPAGPFEPADADHLVGRVAKRRVVSGAQIEGGDVE